MHLQVNLSRIWSSSFLFLFNYVHLKENKIIFQQNSIEHLLFLAGPQVCRSCELYLWFPIISLYRLASFFFCMHNCGILFVLNPRNNRIIELHTANVQFKYLEEYGQCLIPIRTLPGILPKPFWLHCSQVAIFQAQSSTLFGVTQCCVMGSDKRMIGLHVIIVHISRWHSKYIRVTFSFQSFSPPNLPSN